MAAQRLLAAGVVSVASAGAPIAQTTTGPVLGINTATGGAAFLGIPFAAPPQRWGPPVPHAPWTTPLNASTYGAGCIQFLPHGSAAADAAHAWSAADGIVYDEDCLTLDVWIPMSAAAGSPGIVYIHGGGFVTGDGSGDFSSYAAQTGAVIFSVNYRLGSMGFLNLPGMAAAYPTPTDPSAAVPNVGLLDQQAALLWVRANAAAFGCNPDNILLTGQSAGGGSVLFQLTLPASYPAYRAAVAQSPGSPVNPQAAAQALATDIANRLGCPATSGFAAQLACLRSPTITTAMIQEAAVGAAGTYYLPLTLGPSVDGALVMEPPVTAMLNGRFNTNASIVVWETLFEGDSLLYGYTQNVTLSPAAAAAAVTEFQTFTGLNASAMNLAAALYTGVAKADGLWNATTRIWGDALITCGALWASAGAAAYSTKPVHRLVFNTTLPQMGTMQPAGRSTHCTDLPFLFNPPSFFTPAEQLVQADVLGWLVNLAVTGDVNGGLIPNPAPLPSGWPAYNGSGGDVLVVNEQRLYSQVNGWQEDYCATWFSILP